VAKSTSERSVFVKKVKNNKSWEIFWDRIKKYTGGIILVFDFLKNCKGISYQINQDGTRKEYFRSDYLVRDRNGLKHNRIWNKYKHDFNKKIIVGYENNWFYCPEGVWSPSVDAIFILENIKKLKELNIKKCKSILDYGCGTGAVGISIAKTNKNVKKLTLIDINDSALFASFVNLKGNNVRIKLTLSNYLDLKVDDKGVRYDLGIVTPFYFPVEKKDFKNPIKEIAKAGISSAKMVNDLSKICKDVFFIYSSVTKYWFRKALKVNYKDIKYLEVPFSLGDNVSSTSLVTVAANNNLLIRKENDQFKFWHKIYIAKTI